MRMRGMILLMLTLICFCLFMAYWTALPGKIIDRHFKDTPLFRLTMRVSPDGRHLAYVRAKGKHEVAVADGKPGRAYDRIWPLAYSPDSRHLAYGAKWGGRWRVVLDGRPGPYFDALGHAATPRRRLDRHEEAAVMAFSPKGNHFAYWAQKKGHYRVILDGKDCGPPCDSPSSLQYSPDGRHLAFVAHTAAGEQVVIDGSVHGTYDKVDAAGVVFSPDSRKYAYLAYRDRRPCIVGERGEQDIAGCGQVGPPLFSPDGRHLAFLGGRGEDLLVIRDGHVIERHEGALVALQKDPRNFYFRPAVFWSPTLHRDLLMLWYSPLGRIWHRVALADGYHWCADGKIVRETCGLAGEPVFSADGRHWSYANQAGGVTADGYRHYGEKTVSNAATALTYSPDGERLLWVAQDAPFVYLQFNANRWTGRYSRLMGLCFSPDGDHYLYASARPGKGEVLYLDARERRNYERFLSDDGTRLFRFDNPTHLYYLAVKRGRVYLVRERI